MWDKTCSQRLLEEQIRNSLNPDIEPIYVPGCNLNCYQGRRCDCAPKPAESCTEIGSEPTGRPRMGIMHGWERSLLNLSERPGFWVVLCMAVAVASYLVQASK